MKKTYTCIVCPMSCRVTVEDTPDGLSIEGYTCARGKAYAASEHTQPQRTLTATVKVENGRLRRLPVISSAPVPKERLFECLNQVYGVCVQAPIRSGDVVLRDVCGTGVDILAARDVPEFPK